VKDSKVLVTGANGFIGQALCQKLVADGWSVAGAVRNESAAGKLRGEVESVIVGAVGPDTDWVQALSDVDSIVHLAARVHVMRDLAAEPIAMYRDVNVAGTEHLAQMAASMKVRRFIFLSSIKVNGEGKQIPYTECDKPMPSDPYGISKYEAEQLLQVISARTDLEIVVLRPSLVYGPQVKANFLKLFKVIKMGIPLPFANVKNQRSLIFLGNLIDAIALCIDHPKAAGKTYLLSDGVDTSTPELIQKVASMLGKSPRLFPFSLTLLRQLAKVAGKSEAVSRLLDSLSVDCSLICTELDWIPRFTMTEGLAETAKWYLQSVRC
jgi:nucleoside-diphosphate-sugar epimerase